MDGRRTAVPAIVLVFLVSCAHGTGAPRPASTRPILSGPAHDDLAAKNAALQAEVQRLRAELGRSGVPAFWLTIGFLGQVLFGLRFVVQWIVTERRKKSTIPLAFWYLSLAGSVVLLAYAIYRVDPVFIAGFSLNMVIYLRNLYFIHRRPPASPEPASGG